MQCYSGLIMLLNVFQNKMRWQSNSVFLSVSVSYEKFTVMKCTSSVFSQVLILNRYVVRSGTLRNLTFINKNIYITYSHIKCKKWRNKAAERGSNDYISQFRRTWKRSCNLLLTLAKTTLCLAVAACCCARWSLNKCRLPLPPLLSSALDCRLQCNKRHYPMGELEGSLQKQQSPGEPPQSPSQH